MRYLSLSLLTIAVVASVSMATPSGDVGSIAGQVVDRTTKQPLPGANVWIVGTPMGAAAGLDGRYRIDNVPIGEYSIKASMIGYKPLIMTKVYTVPKRTITVNFELEQTVIKVKSITVTPEYFPKHRNGATSSTTLSFYEVRGDPEGYNVQRMLASLPGVATVEDYSSQIIVRGGDPNENLCILDNIEIPNPIHFGWFGGEGGSISILNTELISSIDFLSGGFPAKYGDKLSSLMDIRLKEGNKDKFEANFDFNMSGVEFDLSGPITKSGSYAFAYRRSYLELLDKISDIGNVIPKYDDCYGKIVLNPSQKDKLSLLSIKTNDIMTVPKSELRDAKSDLIWGGGQSLFGFNWRSLFSEKGFSLVTISRVSNYWNLDCEGEFGIKVRQTNFTAKGSITYRISPRNEFEAGIACKYLELNHHIVLAPDTTPTGIPFSGDTISNFTTSYKIASYVQWDLHPLPKLSVKPGIRYDYFELNKESRLSPRVGLTYRISDLTSLNAAYGDFYQSPEYNQLIGNDLHSKHATHWVLGIDHLLREDTKLTLEVYDKKYNNLIVSVSDSTRELDNSGIGYARGVELLLHKKLSNKVWGKLSYSYSVSKRKDYKGWHYSDWDQRHIFTIIGGYKFSDNFELSLKWRYASGRPYTPLVGRYQDPVTGKWYRINGDINSARYPPYHRLDFQIAQRHIFRGWHIVSYFNLQNVYNRKNILKYRWNSDYTERKALYQFLFMPVGGITIEF